MVVMVVGGGELAGWVVAGAVGSREPEPECVGAECLPLEVLLGVVVRGDVGAAPALL